jgi:hypothetical protein
MANKKIPKKHQRLLCLAHTLKNMSAQHRTIILDHLDEKSRDDLYTLIRKVLHSEQIPTRRHQSLKRLINNNKKEFVALLDKSKSKTHRKKQLTQVGGSLPLILATAIPMLMNLFAK